MEVTVDGSYRKNKLRLGYMESATVVSNNVITRGDYEVKRHIEFALPEGSPYRAGDYLAILPVSPLPLVQRALVRLGLHPDDLLTIKTDTTTSLPVNRQVSAFAILSGFLELDQPATLRNVKLLSGKAQEEETKKALQRLSEPEIYAEEVSRKRISLLALLERFQDVDLPLGDFLANVPIMRMRQVSCRQIN
jgi:cytochrome P450/NADPH-cytochrome P450 reductase